MEIFIGDEYEITENYRRNFFSSKSLTIVSINSSTVQFILSNGKGYGAMPCSHFAYLLKRSALTKMMNKKDYLENELQNNEQIS